ncbi:hypothetical protein J3A83DRAFT_4203745 [Scleroderma citrinum]
MCVKYLYLVIADVPKASIFISVWVAFCVQCFYAQRVWIIGGRNKMITVAVVIIASAQLGQALIIYVS